MTRPPVAAGAVGLARRALDEAISYSLQRKTMGKVIAQHQAIAFMIADMATGIEAARLLTYKVGVAVVARQRPRSQPPPPPSRAVQSAWMVDHGQKNTTFASMAKLFASEHCHKCVHDAIQIYGGAGFNEDFPVAKLARVSVAGPRVVAASVHARSRS